MTDIPFFQVDAFAAAPFTGNPAAVMPLEHWLDDGVMQAIAAENNLSETAFTIPADGGDADYELRWFTPTVEVDLCGHATLAAGHVLISGDRIRFATRSGILTVTRQGNNYSLDLPAHVVTKVEAPALLDAIGAGDEVLFGQGHDAAIIPLADEAAVRAVAPNFEALRSIDRMAIVTAPGREQDIVSRVFVSYCGIDEDPVTGSAHAALVPFWAQRLGRDSFTALQASRRSGVLNCRLAGDRVVLGGHCATVIVGTFQL
ncbi:MAG TPA: PhzF family phenazine biosynthesis protein [Sphingomicrobium sp.]|nr:PhzF family phenazine biosynthesis protein [Sphingomicrobium sp.]